MTPLLVSFIEEARDLLESVGKGLLALEAHPGKTEVINGIFRALHTLKGSSGLFDPELAPLTRLFHAGEDLLEEVRKERRPFTVAMADSLLNLVDRATEAMDAVAEDRFKTDREEAPCNQLVNELRALLGEPPVAATAPVQVAEAAEPDWLTALPDHLLQDARKLAAERGASGVLLRYRPDADCFFYGSDPLLVLRQIPGLVYLNFSLEGHPSDLFQCILTATAISLAPMAQLVAILASEGNQAMLRPLPAMPSPTRAKAPYPRQDFLRQFFTQQQEILQLPCQSEEWHPRLQSTSRVVNNCLSRAGDDSWHDRLAAAVQESAKIRSCEPLLQVVQAIVAKLTPPLPGAVAPPAEEATAAKEEGGKNKVIKVDQARIDRLLELTGELVVAKNTVPFLAERAVLQYNTPALAVEIMEFYGLIHRLANDLQAAMMQVRMLPVMHVFQRFPRLVRDISRKLGKNINLVMSGGDTEADKNVIESLSDPLIHLVRNSLDHGVELPEERRRAGKPEEGEIRLHAHQENDRVVIEISDDGRGIDPALVRRKALEKGLIQARQQEEMSDHEAMQLIFAPGFSTMAKVSDLSGRGVGMDVVKTAVESLGGRVQLTSKPGQGTQVRLEMPLSMAVTRVMIIASGGALYGIPLDLVVETVRVPSTSIHPIKGRETTTLRGKLLPLERMAKILGDDSLRPREEEAILVVRLWEEEIGLVVDDFKKGMDVILKPLEGVVAGSRGCAGGALLGDGSVLLVLNLQELL